MTAPRPVIPRDGNPLAGDAVDLGLLDDALARDVRRSLKRGIAAGAVFDGTGGPDELFRVALARALRAIRAKDHADLVLRFLSIGPYHDPGVIPVEQRARFLSDDEVAAAIRCVHRSVINQFKGSLAELLAVGPVCEVARRAFARPPCLFVGDSVLALKPRGGGWAKTADFHLLHLSETRTAISARVLGIAEVKSLPATIEKLGRQLSQHLARTRPTLRVMGRDVPVEHLRGRAAPTPLRIAVVASDWALSREVRFESDGDRTFLIPPPVHPPTRADAIEEIAPGRWLVTLRWSQEALASTAYDMTFWYMGLLGRQLYERARPKGWEEMTPEEAGQNAAKMMLYYAMLRARTMPERSLAIALYNAYGFGYALGANFVDRTNRRVELFLEDLEQIGKYERSRRFPIEVKDDKGQVVRVIPAACCRLRGAKRTAQGKVAS